MAGCTIISRNYLSHARILADSFLKHHPSSRFYILIVDRLPDGAKCGANVRIVDPGELKLSYFYEMCFRYTVTELSTAVKPTFLRFLLDECKEHRVVYLDPDILVMRPLHEIDHALSDADIILTPHITTPIPIDGRRPSERDLLIAGAYNLGFIAVRKSRTTAAFLNWWQERLKDGCHVDPAKGMMSDQRWVDLVPGLFPAPYLLRDPAYNVAYWNLHERVVTKRGGAFLINGQPLAFFHFSGFNPAQRDILSKHQTRTALRRPSALSALFDLYARLHYANGFEECSSWHYGYSRFSNGIAVNSVFKDLYLSLDATARKRFGNPFEAHGNRSFLKWALRPQVRCSGLNPFLQSLYNARHDVRATFPELRGNDWQPFLAWAREEGAREMGYPPELVVPSCERPITSNRRSIKQRRDGLAISNRSAYQPARVPSEGVTVCGYLRKENGLGGAARGYVDALRHLHVPLSFRDVSQLSENRASDGIGQRVDSGPSYGINLVCVNADQHFVVMSHMGEAFFRDHYNIGLWFWELPRFPEKWHDRFPYYEEIWVGSSFIANSLNTVAPLPVVRIPPVLAHKGMGSRSAGRRRLGVYNDTLVYLFIFDFHSYFERKNPLAVIRAFKEAFLPTDNVRLVIKCINEDPQSADFVKLQAAAARYPISIYKGYWRPSQMRDLMAACDVYVSLHRAEGTGLTISDAMNSGKPVIATGWSGNMDFMSISNSYPVRFTLTELEQPVGPYQPGETWAEPCTGHAAHLMRHVYDNPSEAKMRGEAAKSDLAKHFSQTAVAGLIKQRLTTIAGRHKYAEVKRRWQDGFAASAQRLYQDMIGRIHRAVEQSVPADATVAVVNKGDEALLRFNGGRRGWHFPQSSDGRYTGYYPVDDTTALAQLDQVHKKGAGFLLIPKTAFWWLEHYKRLREHLEGNCHTVVKSDTCLLFDIGHGRRASALASGVATESRQDV